MPQLLAACPPTGNQMPRVTAHGGAGGNRRPVKGPEVQPEPRERPVPGAGAGEEGVQFERRGMLARLRVPATVTLRGSAH